MAAPPPYSEKAGEMPPPDAPYGQQPQYPPMQQQSYPGASPGYPPQQSAGQYPPTSPQYPPPGGHYPPPGAHYPPPGAPQQPGYGTTTTVVMQQPATVVTSMVTFQEFPVAMTCPSCHAQIVTAVQCDAGGFAWLLCLIMFIFGFWICCFIPFCVDSCQDATHSCPNCRAQLGTYKRL